MNHDADSPPPARPQIETLLGRAMQLRCPRCGQGELFRKWFMMPERCDVCRLKYEREPGYYLGSSYINYAITAVVLLVAYVAMHFGLGWSNRELTFPLVGFCVIFPLLAFRHCRALWLALDCYFDHSILSGEE